MEENSNMPIANTKTCTDERTPLLPKRGARVQPTTDISIVETGHFPPHDVTQVLEQDPVMTEEFHKLLILSYPVVLTSTLEFLPGFTSIILAGHLDSPYTKEYVDAATLSSMLLNITAFSIGFGLISAMDTLCSQAYGAQRFDKIGIYFQTGLCILSVTFLPIWLLNWYSESLLLLLGQNPQVAELTQKFTRYNLVGLPFLFLYELFRKVLLAQNITQPLVVIALIGNVVSVVTGYVLAYHASLDFYGIAMGRSLGSISMLLLLIPYFWWYPMHLSQWWQSGWNLHESVRHLGTFARLGIPGLLMLILEWWAFEILSLLVGLLPNNVVALSAHSVLLNVTTSLYMVYVGLSCAANVRVGNCLGANEPKKARLVSQLAFCLVTAAGGVLGTILFFMCDFIPTLFLHDAESIALASRILLIWAPMEILDGLNCVAQGIFRGAGKQQTAATTNALAYYGGGIPMAVMLGFYGHFGVEGLWLGFGVGLCTSATMLLVLITRWQWRELAQDAQTRTAE